MWTGWSSCSVTCGNGTHERSRNCSNPAPEPGADECLQLDGVTRSLYELAPEICVEDPCASKCVTKNYKLLLS